MDYSTTPVPNVSLPKFYKENYVVPWNHVTPLDEVSVVVLSICIFLLFVTLCILLYAYIEVQREREMQHSQRLLVIYIHTVLSFMFLLIVIVSMDPIKDQQKRKGLLTAGFLLFYILSSVTWLMLEPLSSAVAMKGNKKRGGLFYVAIGWGIPLLLSSAFIGLHFILREALLDPYLCWFDADTPLELPLTLIGIIFLTHLLSLLIAHACKPGKRAKLTAQRQGLRCMTLNTVLMVPTTYGSLVVYGIMLHDYHTLYEYILVSLLSLQILLMFLRYIIFNPAVKNSLVDVARKEDADNKVDMPLVTKRPVYIP